MKPKSILSFFKSVSLCSWTHLSFKKAGFLDADQFARYLDKEFGDKTIKDLDVELYISATEIERGKLKIFHKNTKVVSAILASRDRKSTRLNSSHVKISYAVFCLKKKNNR